MLTYQITVKVTVVLILGKKEEGQESAGRIIQTVHV
jgi:hypothetical protein